MLNRIGDWLQKKIFWASPRRALDIYAKTPRFVLEQYRSMNFRRTLRIAAERSIFYSKSFETHAVNVSSARSPKDLVPLFTTEKDLTANPSGYFLCGRPDTAFESTGTTSKTPKRIYFSNRELEDAGRVGAAGLWRLGVRPDDRVASSFDYSFWVSGPALKSALAILGAFHVEAGRIDPADFFERVKPYRCNVIVSEPGWLVRLSECAEKKGPWPVKLMIAGGENLAEVSRRYVEGVWGSKVILSYGQTEAFGMIGVECPAQDGYHVNEMDLWAEVPSPDCNGYGELVYTTLRRSVMPLIRYRSGDVTKILSGPCGCGWTSPRLAKLRGRADEMAVTSAGNLAPWMFQEAIEKSGLKVHEWQVRLVQTERRDRIEFHAESGEGSEAEPGVRKTLLEAMQTCMPVAHLGILSGLADFDVKLRAPGALRTERKVKRIVDERNFDIATN